MTKSKGSILIVDDSKPINNYIYGLLKKNDYFAYQAFSANEANNILLKEDIELLLLDVVMPDYTGFQYIKDIKKNPKFKDIPIIFITGVSDKDNIVEGLKLGAVDFVTKPFNETEVLIRISTQIKLYQTNLRLKKELEERKMYQHKIEQQNKELQELNFTKDKFVSILAHDLKNPFTYIMGFTDMLKRKYESLSKEKIKEMIDNICSATKNTYELLINLLEWSRFQSNKIKFKPQKYDFHLLIEEVLDTLLPIAYKKNIKLYNNIDTDLMLRLDKYMMQSIFRNLVSNGIKFTKEGGSVEIYNRFENDVVEIIVKDTGIGINEEVQKKLFKLDSSVSSLGTKNEQGTGLGLIICKEFINKHKGTIKVISEVGTGSKFICSLPTKLSKID